MALSQEQMNALPDALVGHFEQLEADIVGRIARRVEKVGSLSGFTATDLHKLNELQRIGYDIRAIEREIAQVIGQSETQIHDMLLTAARGDYEGVRQSYNFTRAAYVPFENNGRLQDLVQQISRATNDELVNMAHTSALGLVGRDGKLRPIAATYKQTVDYAVLQVKNGQTDFHSAMRRAIRNLSDEGLRTQYPSGHTLRLDSAVRMNLLGGLARLSHAQSELIGEQFGATGFEISWHGGHRPSHDFGGLQFSEKEYYNNILPQMQEPNCYHRSFPIVLGVSTPAYTKEELAELEAKEQELRYFEGKGYTAYEAQQRQRRYETAIRREKDRAAAFKAAGDTQAAQNARIKTRMLNNSYKDFSEAVGLSVKKNRVMGTAGNRGLQNTSKSGIIKVGKPTDKGLFPDLLAGVRCGKPMSFDEANHGRENPNFLRGGGYKINCQSCVVTNEARRRGYDVETLPKSDIEGSAAEILSRWTNLAWIDPTTGHSPAYIQSGDVTTAKRCKAWLENVIEQDKRYTFEFYWKGYKSGHIISAARTADGELMLHDPQSSVGKTYIGVDIDTYLEKIGYRRRLRYVGSIITPPKVLRVDDKHFNLYYVNNIMKGSENP